MSDPVALVKLRCPDSRRSCLLGVVVPTPEGARLMVHRRQLVQQSVEKAAAQVVIAGPYALDELQLVDVGCRHLGGEPLGDHAARLRDVVEAVRSGRATPGVRFVVDPGLI